MRKIKLIYRILTWMGFHCCITSNAKNEEDCFLTVRVSDEYDDTKKVLINEG